MIQKRASRRGIALILVVVCMAILAIMMTSAVRNGLAQKRFHERRAYQVQAYWLAQAGIEQAAARLLTEPTAYNGETLAVIPRSEVRIAVERRKDEPDLVLITSEASYPKDEICRPQPSPAVPTDSNKTTAESFWCAQAASAHPGRPISKPADEKKMDD